MDATLTKRIEQLRHWLAQHDYDALLIPHEDEYLGEYVPEHNERLHWATGFTGSAGAAVITRDKAAIFVDGRYVVQVRKQVPAGLFDYCHLIDEPPVQWAQQQLPKGAKLAIDARMHSAAWYKRTQRALDGALTLVSVEQNPIESLWDNRPAPLNSPAILLGEEKTGRASLDKRQTIGQQLADQNLDAAVLTQPDAVCWLLNIRGRDIPRLPVVLTQAIIKQSGDVTVFIDPDRLPEGFAAHVGQGVSVAHPDSLVDALQALSGQRVLVDPNGANAWTLDTLQQAQVTVVEAQDPCALEKAAKNPQEIAGMRACHVRDGVAVTRFLAWFDRQVDAGERPDEAVLADTLYQFRQQDDQLVDLSFDTISAAGGNAAMCHYNHNNQPKPSVIESNNVYLVDSGGQYYDGTTDITRTVPVGECSAEIKKAFTLVLKGHIALATALFPKGTSGSQLDALARQYLWQHGYDFDHGTGHGVGHFLDVHEGPQRISKAPNSVALLPGMVVSNEPGYYRADAFGIRIENLELIEEKPTEGDMTMLGFASLTRAPIDRRLVDVSLLSEAEIQWWNRYHQTVWDEISPHLDDQDQAWLKQATAPLSR
ncbi:MULTISPECIES: aminopeptidase P family protein [unclassified Salinivibrio]|uniref:aminopeptidase P family protein n=1 Tax=unclassified Salinivibrio TaxID=2636825 RepID=UPI0009852643|nr:MULTISPECIES: aminopeptidase P family protein [unclassified Salinivibrio]OOF14857.1 X-Pro aminopeptidase [Salinivibrio sp. PR919]OOF18826.1 X-Pro aminopeptidase [Salinivibrio sp. PR932]